MAGKKEPEKTEQSPQRPHAALESGTLIPDGGGEPHEGVWIPMDGGGSTFHENTVYDASER